MQNEMIWFDRKFTFNLPAEMFPMVVERLRGTPPRLDQPMRLIDSCFFTVEHDDQYLARITDLISS